MYRSSFGATWYQESKWYQVFLSAPQRRVVQVKGAPSIVMSLKEITARPNLDQLTDYQKWVDEQSDLADAIMGMYQVDTSPENVDVEIEEEEERLSGWVNSLTI